MHGISFTTMKGCSLIGLFLVFLPVILGLSVGLSSGLFLVFPPVFTQAFNAVLALRIYEANPKQRDLHILLAKMPDIDNFRPRFREGGLPDECGHIKMHGERTVHLLPIFRDCHMQSSAINSNYGEKRQKRKNTKNT